MKIAAGIVTYNPELERLNDVLKHIPEQISTTWIIDNGSTNLIGIKTVIDHYSNINLICNSTNLGIAAALNQIFEFAEKDGYDWVLTLDDDSVCEKDLLAVLAKYTQIVNAGIICPEAVDSSMTRKVVSRKVCFVRSCITAGSLTNVEAWKSVGKFDEKMFIDFVDIEFCTRLRENRYRIIKNPTVKIYQKFGNISGKIHFLGLNIYIFNYSPARVYYSVRNQVYYMRKHRKYINVPYQIMYLAGYCVKRILFEDNKRESMKSMGKGIRDGCRMQLS